MSLVTSSPLLEQAHFILGFAPAIPSSASPKRISMKGYSKLGILIVVNNTTGPTGSVVTLKQSKDVAGTAEKELPFTQMFQQLDSDVNEAFKAVSVSGNTFTLDATANKKSVALIEVNASDLDAAGGFNSIRLGLGNAVNQTVGAFYFLWPALYKAAGKYPLVNAAVD